jgi:hypothetical protein
MGEMAGPGLSLTPRDNEKYPLILKITLKTKKLQISHQANQYHRSSKLLSVGYLRGYRYLYLYR